MPAEAGIQESTPAMPLDPRFRGGDDTDDPMWVVGDCFRRNSRSDCFIRLMRVARLRSRVAKQLNPLATSSRNIDPLSRLQTSRDMEIGDAPSGSDVVFVDALALFDGERIRDIVQRSTAMPSGLTAGPSHEDAETRLFADLDPATRAWALARYTLHPIGIYEHPVRLQSFWSQPWAATVIWCRRAVNPGEAHQRRTAERLRAKWFELDTGHYPMLSTPNELTALLTAEA